MFARRSLLAALAATPAYAPGAFAQVAPQPGFPERAVTVISPFPPGGQTDVVGRPFAAGLERHWKQPVPFIARPGAAGELGNAAVARAAPDGYTVLFAISSLAILPEAARILGRPPSYELDQLAPVALFTADPVFLTVRADSPWHTLEAFIADAKRRPGAISYSSSGNYGALHVPMAMLAGAAGIDLLHVPFQGGGPALTALVSGQVDAMAAGPGPITSHVREGRFRVLAGWGAQRYAGFPEAPTLIERGFPEAEYYIWVGSFVPAATPAPVQEALRRGMAAAAADPDVRRAIETSGNTMDYRDGEAFRRFFRTDAERLKRAVQRIGKVE